MKRCPTCDKTFDDGMRFCQADGTPLVDDAPLDPFKTMVARPEDLAAMSSAQGDQQQPADEAVLEIPDDADPRRTMFASEDELRREMDASKDEELIEIPPAGGSSASTEPSSSQRSDPLFADSSPASPPPSPFGGAPGSGPLFATKEPEFGSTTPPIPSPFGQQTPEREMPPIAEPVRPAFDDHGQQANLGGPISQAEWIPPAPVNAGAAAKTQNNTLAIISLVTGLLSILCCGWFVPGLAAIALGYVAKNKADANPAEYGGRSMAIAGMVAGAVSVVLGIIVVILYLFTGALASLGNLG